MAWLDEHVLGVALLIATSAVDRTDADGDHRLLLERLVMHLVADTLTASFVHARWQEYEDPMAMEAYGATQGAIRVTSEVLDEFAPADVLEHVQERLDQLVLSLTSAPALPERPPAL